MIYMLLQFMGEDRLKSGLHDYLERYKFSSAESKDLWKVLEMVRRFASRLVSLKRLLLAHATLPHLRPGSLRCDGQLDESDRLSIHPHRAQRGTGGGDAAALPLSCVGEAEEREVSFGVL